MEIKEYNPATKFSLVCLGGRKPLLLLQLLKLAPGAYSPASCPVWWAGVSRCPSSSQEPGSLHTVVLAQHKTRGWRGR